MFSNGIIRFFQLVSLLTFLFVYSYMFLYMYAFTSNSINFDWYLIFHTYIHILFVLTISLYLWAQILVMLSLIFMTILFQLISFQLVLKQAYASFYLVFHKGGENSYFIFQLVFYLPLISTPTLYDEYWFCFGNICFKWQILSIGIKILFIFSQLVSMPHLLSIGI